MGNRVNRAIEPLAADQAIYYTGRHSGLVLTYEQGLEPGSIDMAGGAEYRGRRTPV